MGLVHTVKLINDDYNNIYETDRPYDVFFVTENDGSVRPNLDRIRSLKEQYDFLLINCSTEHWGGDSDFPFVPNLCDMLEKNDAANFLCLSHDPDDEDLRSKIIYFPFFAWTRPEKPDLSFIKKNDRKYLFSNLNKHARDFRIANYLALINKPYKDRCLISFHNIVQENHGYDGHFILTEEENNLWQKLKFDLPTSILDNFKRVYEPRHPAYCDSFVHLVSETTIKDKIFITEKTWQPVLAGQIFLIWGNAGIVRSLRKFGVDVFDDIIDHSYDDETNHRTRFEKLHNELDRLSLLDFNKIYESTLSRRISNADKFWQGVFIEKYVNKLKEKLPPGNYDFYHVPRR